MCKVSIIIPNYNHALYLKKRIDSVLEQSYQDFEVLLLDDCSTDQSREIMSSYANHPKVKHLIFNDLNSGSPFLQWEKGLELAKGEFIWIAESDDWAEKSYLSLLMNSINSNKNIGMAYCQSYDVNSEGKILRSRLEWTADIENNRWEKSFEIEGHVFLKDLFKKNIIPNVSACIFRKYVLDAALQELKKYRPFKMAGDWFAWLFIANITEVKIAFINEHLNYFRLHDKSTRTHNTIEKKRLRIVEEAIIFNSVEYNIDRNILVKKNSDILNKWIQLYRVNGFNASYYEIKSYIPYSKVKLLSAYVLNKIKALVK